MPFVKTPTGRIYVESHGQGPPLVIAPAYGATTRTYRGLLPNLTQTHRVLLYDLRGMGQSDDLADHTTIESMADDLAAVLDHFGVDRASVLGLSMGAIIAQMFAVRHRQRLDRLVLVTPPVRRHRHGDAINGMLADLMEGCDPGRFLRHMLYLALSPDFVNRHSRVVEQIMDGIEVNRRDGETLRRILRGVPAFEGAPGISAMDAPTLIIAGELDLLTPPSQARALHAELPNSKLIVMEGVSHTPFIERTHDTFAAVRAFLTDCEEPATTDGGMADTPIGETPS